MLQKSPYKMNSFGQAIAMNNECVQLVKNGRIAEGLLMLQRATAKLQDFSQQREGSGSVTAVAASVPNDFWFGREPKNLEPVGHFYVYDRPMDLSPLVVLDKELVDGCPHGHVLLVSTALVFNLALLNHQHARQSGASRYWMHAGLLYDMVLSLLDNADDCHNESLQVLTCLALNNRANVYYETCEYTASMSCLDELCDVLMACDDIFDHFIVDTEAAEIRRNVMYVHVPSAASSA
jgi:hypothetical protein